MVSKTKVDRLHKRFYIKPRELVNKLMREIVGVEQLKKSSAIGKNNWDAIPENIYDSVEGYVNNNAPKVKYRISHKDYRETLTYLCATLRNPKKDEKITRPKKIKKHNEKRRPKEALSSPEKMKKKAH
ncbi:uncharacterized protein LOC106655042 [Trichogramma pretiosum]|uniref:uncharacterized protein LOC106655042 n=1 Tax=Trichogramma pretiosum TaxID=7493 RepID=UPI0006C98C34|nr:uncharacterized protein LOC106655042 [Trichogramma pretiosum]